MTPMLKQYFGIKEENPGCILLFRCGDFYETYGEDADIASKELDIVLTSKDAGAGSRVSMAGVPYFAIDQYLPLLVGKGYKVAICEQMEDPKKAKGLVKRDVVRIVSAGTILEPEMLDKMKNNYILCIVLIDERLGFALADISTGDYETTEFDYSDELLLEELGRWSPSELLLSRAIAEKQRISDFIAQERLPFTVTEEVPDVYRSEEIIREHFSLKTLLGTGIYGNQTALIASATLMTYLMNTQRNSSLSLRMPRFFSRDRFLSLDCTSKRNLELIETIMGRERKGTLLWAMDHTSTAMGARLLRSWITRPLLEKGEIEKRLDSVQELISSNETTQAIVSALKKIQDMERLLSKIIYGTCNARDMIALESSLEQFPAVSSALRSFKCELLSHIAGIDTLTDIANLLTESLLASPPATVREGNMIKPGFNRDLDELRSIRKTAKEWISQLEEREKKRSGIKSLKVGFNQVFGYYIEITKANLKMVPEDYIRKQTIAGGERFISTELKEYEEKVLSADERIKSLEYEIFTDLRESVAIHSKRIQEASGAIAMLDVLVSFAKNAMENVYCRPVLEEGKIVDIREGRHPVIEKLISDQFIRNDLYLDEVDRMIIVTGPNMSGKSTYLRQVALITIMAQVGSFVPATAARIGITDRIFTRVGATDDLHLGRSTFMVEMLETANIINNATDRSLVVLDEIGRGTSTYDGLSIAWAVAEFLYQKIGAKTLFATHFHELTNLSKVHQGIKNRKVAVKETRDEVIFLHKILPGASDKSYGIYVARLAGFPEEILAGANAILEVLEGSKKTNIPSKKKEETIHSEQLTFFEDDSHPVIDEIRKLNIMEMTPLQALNRIYKWQRSIERFKRKETSILTKN